MSQLNRKQLKRMLLKEFKMMGMAPMGAAMIGHSPYEASPHGCDSCGCSPCQCDEHDDQTSFSMPSTQVDYVGGHKGEVSREDCCKAVLCLIECCSCPETKQMLRDCCEDLLAGR